MTDPFLLARRRTWHLDQVRMIDALLGRPEPAPAGTGNGRGNGVGHGHTWRRCRVHGLQSVSPNIPRCPICGKLWSRPKSSRITK